VEQYTVDGPILLEPRLKFSLGSQLVHIVNENRTRADPGAWFSALELMCAAPPLEFEAVTAQNDFVLSHLSIERDGGLALEECERDEAGVAQILGSHTKERTSQDEIQEFVDARVCRDIGDPDVCGVGLAGACRLQDSVHPVDCRIHLGPFLVPCMLDIAGS
jgi:hypothetical protein